MSKIIFILYVLTVHEGRVNAEISMYSNPMACEYNAAMAIVEYMDEKPYAHCVAVNTKELEA